MPPTQAQIGYQTFLQRGDGQNPETFTTVTEITKLDGPSAKVDMKEATNMSSPPNSQGRPVKEVIPGAEDPGTITAEFSWVPGNAQHAGIFSDMHGGVLRNWKIVMPAQIGKSFSCAGYVSEFGPSYPVDDRIVGKISIEVSGPVAFQ
jgi:hypothetical protein